MSSVKRQQRLEELSIKFNVELDIVQFFADNVFQKREDYGELISTLEYISTLSSKYIQKAEPVSMDELMLII